jgi:hypothetical protein
MGSISSTHASGDDCSTELVLDMWIFCDIHLWNKGLLSRIHEAVWDTYKLATNAVALISFLVSSSQ